MKNIISFLSLLLVFSFSPMALAASDTTKQVEKTMPATGDTAETTAVEKKQKRMKTKIHVIKLILVNHIYMAI